MGVVVVVEVVEVGEVTKGNGPRPPPDGAAVVGGPETVVVVESPGWGTSEVGAVSPGSLLWGT